MHSAALRVGIPGEMPTPGARARRPPRRRQHFANAEKRPRGGASAPPEAIGGPDASSRTRRRHPVPDGRTAELDRARAVPTPDHLTGPLRDAARAARRAVTTYDEIHAHGRALVDRRSKVHAEDERNAARLMGAGKQLGESKLLLHDAELADEAERLSAAAGAVVVAVRDLEAWPRIVATRPRNT